MFPEGHLQLAFSGARNAVFFVRGVELNQHRDAFSDIKRQFLEEEIRTRVKAAAATSGTHVRISGQEHAKPTESGEGLKFES